MKRTPGVPENVRYFFTKSLLEREGHNGSPVHRSLIADSVECPDDLVGGTRLHYILIGEETLLTENHSN